MPSRTKPTRVALLFEYATLNGGEQSMLACIDWLRKQSAPFEFVAVAPHQGRLADALAERGIELFPWSSGTANSGQTRDKMEEHLLAAVQSAAPDVLHANSLAMGRMTGRLADRFSIPVMTHLRDILNLSAAAMRDLNRNRWMIAVSEATRDFHVARGLSPDKLVVVRNGIDLDHFQPRERIGWLHRELGLPSTARLIATIGQIGLRKGQDVLAEAAPLIAARVPDIHFLIIGERSSTKSESIEFEQAIIRTFRDQQLSGQLHRLGYRSDVVQLLAELDLIVHPANQEPFGRVLVEAAACGVPVVATNVGGTAEIVVDGVTGCLVPPRDPAAMAEHVVRLLCDEDSRQRMRQASRIHAETNLGIASSAQSLSEYWRHAIRFS